MKDLSAEIKNLPNEMRFRITRSFLIHSFFALFIAPSFAALVRRYLIALSLLAGIAAFDHFTRLAWAFDPLYLIPVVLISWRQGILAGFLFSFLSIFSWVIAYPSGANGDWKSVLFSWNTVAQLVSFFTVSLLISLQQFQGEMLKKMIYRDPLTGLANTHGLHEHSRPLLRYLSRRNKPLIMARFDIDRFDAFNKKMGREKGDALLVFVSQFLLLFFRKSDLVARLGGDQFAVLFPSLKPAQVAGMIKKIKSGYETAFKKNGWDVTLSAAFVSFSKGPHQLDKMLEFGAERMERIKAKGKNIFDHTAVK
ncbi:MAG: diguanylate cyclase [Spirochaetia bacterium]|nr:diguanylate cyclase [Spirochaetia bacterium]